MTVLTHPVSKSEEKIADSIKDLLKKSNVDLKGFESSIKLSSENIEPLQDTILYAKNRLMQTRLLRDGTPESELHRIARAALEMVTVTIGKPLPLDPAALNSGETAAVPVTITNSCDLPLRDIVLELKADATDPVLVLERAPFWGLVNPQHIAALQCGESKMLRFFIRAKQIEDIEYATLKVNVFAQLVPFVCRTPVEGAAFPVYPK